MNLSPRRETNTQVSVSSVRRECCLSLDAYDVNADQVRGVDNVLESIPIRFKFRPS